MTKVEMDEIEINIEIVKKEFYYIINRFHRDYLHRITKSSFSTFSKWKLGETQPSINSMVEIVNSVSEKEEIAISKTDILEIEKSFEILKIEFYEIIKNYTINELFNKTGIIKSRLSRWKNNLDLPKIDKMVQVVKIINNI